MEIPDGMWLLYTFIYPTQDEAVQVWQELVDEWCGFRWNGEYGKWLITYKIWYDPELPKMTQSADVYELPKGKKKTKKLLEQKLRQQKLTAQELIK